MFMQDALPLGTCISTVLPQSGFNVHLVQRPLGGNKTSGPEKNIRNERQTGEKQASLNLEMGCT